MVPAALIAPCLVCFSKLWNSGTGTWKDWALLPLGLAVVLFIATLVNVWAYVAERWSNVYANIRTVQNSTPEVRMFEAAKGMHPDAVKALLVHRRTVWRVKYIPLKDTVDWILDEAPNVHAGFVDFVLDRSNGTLMSKRLLSEGSKQFDPEGIVTDYEQYDNLVWLLKTKLMCTDAYGNQSPKFLPPWNVELLRKRFGLDGEGYQVDEEMSEAMKQVVAEQSKGGAEATTSVRREASSVPNVIEQALADLEQTSAMKANAARVYNLKS
jgi:hypothetical protein